MANTRTRKINQNVELNTTYDFVANDGTFSGVVTGNSFVGPLTGDVTGTVSSLSNHDTDDLTEGTNLYFTTARARAAFSAGTGVNITSGVISIGQSVSTVSDVTFGSVTAATFSGALTGDVTGNADTASALEAAVNIALTGSVTGNADFDGSGNILITTTTNHNHDDRYYTETESDGKYLLNTTDTLDGNLTVTGDLSVTGTIDLSNADLNIGAADIIFDTASGGSTRGLIWNVTGTGFLSKLIGGGADGGKVTLFANMDDAITTGNIFEIKDGSLGSLFLGLSHAGILTAGGGTSTQWNTAYTYSQVGHLPLTGGTLTGTLNGLGANFTDPVTIYDDASSENPRLSVGREAAQSLNFGVEDRVALIYHVQDEGSGGHSLEFSINSPDPSKTFYWLGKQADGTSPVVFMTLNSSGITATGYNNTNWDTAYSWGDHDGLYAPSGYGIGGSSILGSGDNANSKTLTGFYYFAGSSNIPTTYFQAGVLGSYNGDFAQYGIGSNQEMYFRWSDNSWKTIIHSGSIGSQSVAYATSAGTATDLNAADSTQINFNNATNTDYSTMTFTSRAWQDVQGVNGLAYTFNTHTNAGNGGYGALQIYYGESGYVYAPTSFRAPIFHDSNDTNYYVDPASTSNLNALNVGGQAVITAGNISSQSVSYAVSAGAATTSITFVSDRTNYKGYTDNAVSGQLMWKQYGNNHTIFDASAGTSPSGTTINRHTPDYQVSSADGNNSWGLNPNLMGWNGGNTYGVKVDWSRYSETSGSASTLGGYASNQTGGANTIVQRDANGYIQNSYFYTSGGGSERNGSGISYVAGFNSSDYYIRSYTMQGLASAMSGVTMNINGNATTANGANGNFYIDDNYGNTIVGVYTSTRYQGVFAMGDAYKLPADGTSTGSLYGLAWSHPNAGGVAGNLNDHGLLVINNGAFAAAISSSIRAASDMRAPIFYDSDNTNYKVDPNSTSLLNELYLAGAINYNGSVAVDSGYGLYFGSSRDSAYGIFREPGAWSHPYPDLRIAFHTGIKLGANSGYNGIRFYTDYDMGTQVMSVNNGSDGVGAGHVHVNNIMNAGGSVRAPIFYDNNDTTYYVDPASDARVRKIWIDNGGAGGVSWSSGLNMGDGSNYWNLIQDAGTARQRNFGTGGYDWYNNSASTQIMLLTNGGDLTTSSSLRTPIFYDSNDTTYYGDFASTSLFNVVRIGVNATQTFAQLNISNGLGGATVYRDIDLKGSWGAGEGHAITATHGSSSTNIVGQMVFQHDSPGSRIKWGRLYHSGDQSTYPMHLISSGSSAYLEMNTGDMRAPIFYDYNNTGYYVDPASTSNLAGLAVANTISGSVSARSAYSGYLETAYAGGAQSNPQVYFNNGVGLKAAMTGHWSVWSDTLWINGYAGGDVLQMCALHTLRNGQPRIAISAQASTSTSYGAIYELWSSYNMDAPNKSGTSYYQTNTWMQFNGAYGLYWPSNYGAHFYPNDFNTYTQFRLSGSKNGYGGIVDSYSAVSGMMYDSAGNGGIYRQANDRWYLYHLVSNNCTSINTSVSSSAYGLYVEKGIYSTGDITAYSDIRKKTNIATIDSALDKVTKLRGVYYDRIDDLERGRQIGVIAQEVNEVLPEAVTYAEDIDEYGVKYGNIVGVLIEAIKEQQKQIEELKAIVDGLTK